MNPGFARLIVESGNDRTEVDLAADARLFPAEPGRPAPLLSGTELAVDKVLAVFGRAEARDFVDLMAVERRYGLDRLFELAAEKDRGFTPALFAEMLGRFGRLCREEFEIDDPSYDQLGQELDRWRKRAIEVSHQREQTRKREQGRGPDLGR